MKSFIKQKQGNQLGYRTPSFIRGKRFGSQKPGNFFKHSPSMPRTQHKG